MLNQQLFCQRLKKRKEMPEKMKKLKKPPLGEEARKSFLHRCGLFTGSMSNVGVERITNKKMIFSESFGSLFFISFFQLQLK